jgi:hypothetical protein
MNEIGPNSLPDKQILIPSEWWSCLEELALPCWLRVPAWARRPVRLCRLLLQAALTRVPVAWYRGKSHPSGRTARLLVAGAEPWVKYLPWRLLATAPQRQTIGTVPMWSLPGLLRSLRTSADLTIVRVDYLSARLFFDATYLPVPEWTETWLTLPENPYSLVRASGNVREDLRRIRRYRLEPEVSHKGADFDLFYFSMYLPYVHSRYGELAALHKPVYLRHLFNRGGIIFVQENGQRVAGQLFARHKQILHLIALGGNMGQAQFVRNGALAACYIFGINHAYALGCTHVDFGCNRSVLEDGVLRFKAKWGIRVNEKRPSEFMLMVHWNRLDGLAGELLSHTSLMFRESGGLSAIHNLRQDHPATQADATAARHTLWIDGLRHLCLVSPAGWSPGIQSPPQTRLLNSGVRPESLQTGESRRLRCF